MLYELKQDSQKNNQGQLRLYFSLLPLRFMRNELTQPAAAYQYHFVNNANLTCN